MLKVARVFGKTSTVLEPTQFGSAFVVKGTVGVEQIDPLLSAVVNDIAAGGHMAAVCDYRQADMTIGASRIVQAHASGGIALDWPTALVVPREQQNLWQDYAAMQGQRGKLRRVFLEWEPARKWAEEQAALRAAQFRWFSRAR